MARRVALLLLLMAVSTRGGLVGMAPGHSREDVYNQNDGALVVRGRRVDSRGDGDFNAVSKANKAIKHDAT